MSIAPITGIMQYVYIETRLGSYLAYIRGRVSGPGDGLGLGFRVRRYSSVSDAEQAGSLQYESGCLKFCPQVPILLPSFFFQGNFEFFKSAKGRPSSRCALKNKSVRPIRNIGLLSKATTLDGAGLEL